MTPQIQTLFHASYVAFVFGVLLFGALAFRQVLDNLALRRRRVGEDRATFLSAPAMTVIAVLFAVNVGIGYLTFRTSDPSVYAYALPLILFVQNLQLLLRAIFQRHLAKTQAVVVRSMLFERLRIAPYGEIIGIVFEYGRWWVTVTLDVLPDERISFRIFRRSAPALARILQCSCFCPVRAVGRVPTHDPSSLSTSA